ncbi:MAG: hypothetical protein AAF557_06795 [Pseudomonadota bacterium]
MVIANGLANHLSARYGRTMGVMIAIGAVMAVLGLGGVLWCIRKAAWMKNADLDAESARAEINRLIFVHMAAIGAAFLGLGLLVTGLLLS